MAWKVALDERYIGIAEWATLVTLTSCYRTYSGVPMLLLCFAVGGIQQRPFPSWPPAHAPRDGARWSAQGPKRCTSTTTSSRPVPWWIAYWR